MSSIIEYHIGVKIKANTVGFFIANDAEEVRRASVFCKVIKSFLVGHSHLFRYYFAQKMLVYQCIIPYVLSYWFLNSIGPIQIDKLK